MRVSQLTPPTCVSSPAPSCASCSECTEPCSSRNVSPESRPSDPACASSSTCSSVARSRNELGSPLSGGVGGEKQTQTTERYDVTSVLLKQEFKAHQNKTSTFHHTPWIGATPELSAFALHLDVAADDGEWYAVLQVETFTLNLTRRHI